MNPSDSLLPQNDRFVQHFCAECKSIGCRITGSDATSSIVKPSMVLNARSASSGRETLSPCTQLVSLSPPVFR